MRAKIVLFGGKAEGPRSLSVTVGTEATVSPAYPSTNQAK